MRADKEARRFSDVFDPAKIQGKLSADGVVWERMVQCVKKVLAHTMKELVPKRHVQENLLIEAENIVNSRPLTHLPITMDQKAPLTPNDLLKGMPDVPNIPGDDELASERCTTRKQWRIARMIRDRFWKWWVHEYLPTLVGREKGCQRVEPMRRGDLLYICEPYHAGVEKKRR